MRTCACVLETYVRTDSTIYTVRLIIEHPREWLASLADNLASEASPTPGCSIEISRDIYIDMSVCRMSVVCQINCVGGITCGPRACSKSVFGG